MSPQIESILGFPVSDWLDNTSRFFFDHVHPEDVERIEAEIKRTHETGENFRLEYRMIAADGRIVWVLDETVAVRDDEYRPLFLQGYLMDVTDRRATDNALRTSEDLYRLVVEGSRDLIAVIDAEGMTTYVSPAVTSLLGHDPARFTGTRFGSLMHPDDVEHVRTYFAQRAAGIETPSSMSARVQHAEGHWVDLEGSISVMGGGTDGMPMQFVCIARPAQRAALRPAAA
jgi:PAS domain S-box-containing protein